MKVTSQSSRLGRGGFTISELLIASALSVTVMGLAMTIFITLFGNWRTIQRRMQADSDVNIALSRMVYGMGAQRGLRSASATTVTNTATANGWIVSYRTSLTNSQTYSFTYSSVSKALVFNPGSQLAGTNIWYAKAFSGTMSLVVTMRVDKVDGVLLTPKREIGTEIAFRNE